MKKIMEKMEEKRIMVKAAISILLMACVLQGRSVIFDRLFNVLEVSAQEPEYISDIKEEELVEVSLNPDECRHAKYRFVPQETDSYVFYSVSDSDTSAYLYNSSDTIINSDTVQSGRVGNFSLQAELIAGNTYYIGVQFAESSSKTGTFLFGVKRTLKMDNFTQSSSFPGNVNGIVESIDDTNRRVRFRFQPEKSGYYSIYSKDYCQELGICDKDCICQEQGECKCLNELRIDGYIQGDNEELKLFCYSESGRNWGFIVYTYFQAGQTYYFEISAIDEVTRGNFILCIGQGLNNIVMDKVEVEEKVEGYLEDCTQDRFYQIQPKTTDTYHFQSQNGKWLYLTIYNSQMKQIAKTEELKDDFDVKVKLEQGQVYYLKVSTQDTMTVNYQFQVAIVKEPVIEDDPGNKPNNSNGGTQSKPSTGSTNKRKAISSLKVSVVGSKEYTGKKIKPSIVMKDGKITLKKGRDYILSYGNNVKIGTAKITITGIGKYSGKRTASFKIIPKKTKIKKAQKKGKKLSLKWNKVKGVSGYEIKYSNSSKFKKAKTKRVKGCKVTLKLKNKKKWYVKIRAYKTVGKSKVYGKYCKVKKC